MNDFELLAAVWEGWAALGARLDPDAWDVPTRCEGWTVLDVTAHVSQGVSGLGALADSRRVDGDADHPSPGALMRALKPNPELAASIAAKNADLARRDGQAHAPAELIERLERGARQARDLASMDPTTTVDYFGHGTTTIAVAVQIRVIEGVVHMLDVAEALRLQPVPLPEGALRRTAVLLLEMAPLKEFIEFATGRSARQIFPVHT
jgi:uncharacterized protein (TIGR03083 family)